MKACNKNIRGFTLFEMVIVIAVIAILAVIAIPALSGVGEQANEGTGFESCTLALQYVQKQQSNSQIGKAYFVYNGYVYKYEAEQLSPTEETKLTVAEKKTAAKTFESGEIYYTLNEDKQLKANKADEATEISEYYTILYYTATIRHVVVYLSAEDYAQADKDGLLWSVPQGSWSSESSDMEVSLK